MNHGRTAGGQTEPPVRALYSTTEVGQMVGKTGRTIRSWIEDGRLPGERVGNRWYVRATDVNEWLGLTPDIIEARLAAETRTK